MSFDLDAYRRLCTTDVIGALVVYRHETGSTMDDARRGAAEGQPVGTAYVAGRQASGRGRQGRSWSSDAGGLYVTFHLRAVDPGTGPLYSLAGALAVAEAVGATGIAVDLKWPNDVLHAGRKVAGILAESAIGERIDVFLGIGVNVRATPMPRDLAGLATSIEQAGGRIPTREALLADLAAALEQRTSQLREDPPALVAAWRDRLATLGQRVRLGVVGGEAFEGEAVDVTTHGELVLRLDDGSARAFAAGDVTTLP
jgi:BirA family biotin operon repressor/biotin-[acetyl-CoA-carboxylase] ligase